MSHFVVRSGESRVMTDGESIDGFRLLQAVVSVKGKDGKLMCEGTIEAMGTENEMRDYLNGAKTTRKRRSAVKHGDSY